ncbi:speckle-type POZ protein B [Caerostris extrusa]|uniref:Speckle-type POZ protein B n=1 Tax=Caerostris extrusa TaxID=172846 RepID=A0AAV4UFJ9_CAEEX|nr:speckle-type POZ protein B [Caerostris extrusa]
MWMSDGKTERNGECFARTLIVVEVVDFILTACDHELKLSTIKVALVSNFGDVRECLSDTVWFNRPANRQRLLASQITRNTIKTHYECNFRSTLSLLCEVSFCTGITLQDIEVVRYGKANVQTKHPVAEESPEVSFRILKSNMKSLIDDGFATDVELKSETRSFPAHKSILSARSAFFSDYFSKVGNVCDSDAIPLLDDDTEQRMHSYMYTADIDVLDWESTCRLYSAAAVYGIIPLKERCSSSLKANLQPSNACQALHLAALHQDGDLNLNVQEFILKHSKEIIDSAPWKTLVKDKTKLAVETLNMKFKE